MTDDRAALAATLAGADTLASIRPRSEMPVTADAGDRPPLVFGVTLGQGGMAIVRSATQTTLGREVAVKAALGGGADADLRLLREAWVTGALEHPNIVPVHDVSRDEHARPLIVLKRIEGSTWSSWIAAPDRIRERFGADPLEWNLGLLCQVCQAVAFAHSRGIIHRDLKPANVMIGEFGEVYVLDWGIAVSVAGDRAGRLPRAADATELAGTLAYMAPEMLTGAQPPTARTDVYLLGAILHEIVTGRAPHLASTIDDTLASIERSQPAVPTDVPEELAAIGRRAMARDPADRHAGADELRRDLLAFVAHRGSAEVTQAAANRLAALETGLRDAGTDPAARVAVYQLFGQCRFGFQEALRAWPANAAARDGLDRAIAAMAAYELDHGDARAAAVLVAELATPRPELAARLAEVERASAAEAAKVEALKQLGAQHDVAYGSSARVLFVVGFAIAFAMLPLMAGLFPAFVVDHPTSLIVTGISIAAICAFAYAARAKLFRTAVNRGVVLTLLVALVSHATIEALTWAVGLDMALTHLLAIAAWVGASTTAAVFIDRSLLAPSIGFVAALGVAAKAPEQRMWAMSWSLMVLGGTGAYVFAMARRGRRLGGLIELLRR